MADTGDVGGYFHTISQTDPGDFSDGGVWFFGSFGRNFSSHSSLEGGVKKYRTVLDSIETARQSNRLGFASNLFSIASNKLINCGHG